MRNAKLEKDRELLCALFKALTKRGGQILRNENDRTISRVIVSLPARQLPDYKNANGAFQIFIVMDLDRCTTLPKIIIENDLYSVKATMDAYASERGTSHYPIASGRGSESRESSNKLDQVLKSAEDYFERLYGETFTYAYDTDKQDVLDVIGLAIAETVNDVVDYVDHSDDTDILNSRCTSGDMRKNGRTCKYDNGINIILRNVTRTGEVDYDIGLSQDIIRAAKNDRIYD